MRHAFLIIAHNNWDQLEKFLSAIDSKKCDFFIHVNSKIVLMDDVVKKLKSVVQKSKVYLTDRVPITWGDYGICNASLTALKMAKSIGGGYTYYHLLTGSDLLLKSINDFDLFFEKNQYCNQSKTLRTNYINASLPNKKHSSRIYYYNFFIPTWRNVNPLIRKIATSSSTLLCCIQKAIGINRWRKNDFKLYHGSSWWSISDDFAEYLLSNSKWIETQFGKRTFAADEFAPQTVIMKSPFKDSIYESNENIDGSLRLIDWQRGNGYGSPHIWKMDDKQEIMNSGNLIGRKFDENMDKDIVDFVLNKIKE